MVSNEQKLPIGDKEFGNLDVFFNSVTHLETTKQKLEKIFMAVFLYQCFEHTGYFKNLQDEGMYSLIFYTPYVWHYKPQVGFLPHFSLQFIYQSG